MLEVLDTFDIVTLDTGVLDELPSLFPTLLSSLNAIHWATALLARAQAGNLRFAAHDRELATAAQAIGLEALGTAPPPSPQRA
jgi:hypothetical protein